MAPIVHDKKIYIYLGALVAATVFNPILLHGGKRENKQFYTTSASLHKPEFSAARKLIDIRSKNAYITHLGFDPNCFDDLHKDFDKEYPSQAETGRPRALDSKMVLALVLMWLHTTMKQESLCLIFGVTPATVSRAKNLGMQTLLSVFEKKKNDPRWKISWPSTNQMETFNQMLQANTTNDFERGVTEGVFGFVDGLNLRIDHPANPLEQNAYYNGWKGDCFASQVIVYTPDGCICYAR